jgi:hypothetical protein
VLCVTASASGLYTVTVTTVGGLPQILKTSVRAEPADIHQPWPMHHVCRDFLIANSLNAADVDGDDALDLVVGGRRHPITKTYSGLRWLRAPTDAKARRDLAKWTTHFLDPDTPSGHGSVFADLDGDKQPDVVDANADWDTPRHEQELYWSENPGAGQPAQLEPWPRHSI